MPVQAFIGVLSSPLATGTAIVTNPGFPPNILISYSAGTGGIGAGPNGDWALGFAVANSSTAVFGCQNRDGVGTTVCERFHWSQRAVECFPIVGGAARADLRSVDALGFTLNWTTVSASSSFYVHYLALSSSEITNATVGSFLAASSTGAQNVTGVGFKPDTVLFFCSETRTTDPTVAAGDIENFIGAAISSSRRWATTWVDQDAVASDQARSYQDTANCIAKLNDNAAYDAVADLTSLDTDGFTVNWSTIVAEAQTSLTYYCALKGTKWDVGSFVQPSSTGAQNVTGLGFTPSGTLFFSGNKARSATTSNDYRISIGCAVSSSSRFTGWAGSRQNADPVEADKYTDTANCIVLRTASSTSVTNALADYTSNDSDGFTLDWSTVDATAREVLYLAFGPTPVVVSVADESFIFTG